jgi:Fe-S cluster assembly protein SufD
MPLSQAVESHGHLVDRWLGTVVGAAENVFTARNAAEWAGGAFVYVPAGVKVEAPIVLTAVQAAAQTALNWRVLVVLEEGAEAEVWEQYASTEPGLFTTVVELVVGENANLRFVSGQGLSEQSWVFGTQRAKVARNGTLDWVVLGFGAGNGKIFQNTILEGDGAEGKVTGAYALSGRQHLDYDTTQEHAAAHCTSDLAFRGILAGRSSAVWRGMIKVDPGAQETDAFQESRNLLLSKKAHADAIPGLEILANDVRCTHAAAIAQIDPEQLFYLRARGLSLEVASRLVIEGFLAELVERFEEGPMRDALAGALERRLAAVLG